MTTERSAMWTSNLKWIYRAWRYRLVNEKDEIAFVRRHLAAGDVALDIGAHKGAQQRDVADVVHACVADFGYVFLAARHLPRPLPHAFGFELVELARRVPLAGDVDIAER